MGNNFCWFNVNYIFKDMYDNSMNNDYVNIMFLEVVFY